MSCNCCKYFRLNRLPRVKTHEKTSRDALRLTDPLPDHLAPPLPPSRRLHTSMLRSLREAFAGLSGGKPSPRGTTSPDFYRGRGGLNSTLQTGWLIFMSFGSCSRSLALPGNYPADQSTARAASRPLWRFRSPGLLFGRRCCGVGGGSKTLLRSGSTSGRQSDAGCR